MAYDFGSSALEQKEESSSGLIERTALCGTLIAQNPVPKLTEETLDYLLERGILLLGAAGTGKTNVEHILVRILIRKILRNPNEQNILFIFDSKGDYLEEHIRGIPWKEAYVVGSGEKYQKITKYPNLLREIMSKGPDGKLIYTEETDIDALELAEHLFDRMKSESQPIFTNMTQQLFAAMLVYFARRYVHTDQSKLNNLEFSNFLKTLTAEKILQILELPEMDSMKKRVQERCMGDYHSMINYISGGKSGNQSQGVLSYLNALPYELFIGPFAKADPEREFSIREIFESKKSAVIFLEYDLKRAETLSPIYGFLIDQTLKYGLGGRDKERGSCCVLLDEWARIKSRLKHMENALSMGRSQNLKIVCGLQNISSLGSVYCEEEKKSILAGFQTVVGFQVPDIESKKFLSERSGRNYQNYAFTALKKNHNSQREGYCLEDWDIQKLKCGHAAVIMPGEEPFYYTFPEYKDWKRENEYVK